MIKPSKQGHLDSLCGLYSIINAVDTLGANLTLKDRKKLFSAMITAADQRWGLVCVIKNGLTKKQFLDTLNAANCVLMQRKGMFLKSRRPLKKDQTLDDIWQVIDSGIANGEVVIVGTSGNLKHWTVVRRVTDKQLQLCDSDRRSVFNKSQCATPSAPKNDRESKTIIEPKEVVLLQLVRVEMDRS